MDSQVVAIASRDVARATAFAAKHGIARAYGSYDDLLADPAIEAVYVPLPFADAVRGRAAYAVTTGETVANARVLDALRADALAAMPRTFSASR